MAKKGENKKTNVFFSAEVFGMALALLCALCLICLSTGDLLFGDIGVRVSRFFLGVFGYLSFPVLLLCIYLGLKWLIGFKLTNKKVKGAIWHTLFYMLFIGLIVQTALTNLSTPLYNDYLSACYNGGISLANSTAGGVFLGLIAYPVSLVLSPIGAYVLYGLALVIQTVFLFRFKISEMVSGRKEEKQLRKQENRKEKGNEKDKKANLAINAMQNATSDQEDFVSEEEFKPKKNVIFGGGAFEMKTANDKKGESSQGLKVLFNEGISGNDFAGINEKPRRESSTSPIFNERSYRESYDRDMQAKTNFVRQPYQPDSRSTMVSSPMGDYGVQQSSFDEPERSMHIDLSQPERDVYVVKGGKERENISSFDRRVNPEDDYNRDRFSSQSDFNRDRFTTQSDYNRDRFSSQSDYNNDRFSSREQEDNFGSRERFNSTDRGFNSTDRGFSSEERGFNSTDRGFNSTDRGFNSREESVSRGGYSEDYSSSRNLDNQRDFSSARQENLFNQQPSERTQNLAEERSSEEQNEKRQNPFATAQRERELRFNERKSDSESAATYNAYSSESEDYEASSYDAGGGGGGNFFIETGKTTRVKPTVSRDLSHKPTYDSAESTRSSFNQPTAQAEERGKQLSMKDIPPENKLENPIDNIPKSYKYVFPPISLLRDYAVDEREMRRNAEEQAKRGETIVQILKNGNIDAIIEDIKVGPAITRFELSIPRTVSIKRVNEKYEDLNLWLASREKIRLVAPIQGTSKIGIEVPNSAPATVSLKCLIESKEFKHAKKNSLTFAVGKDVIGNPVNLDIAPMPHLLVAGATGTGKSVFLNTLLISLIYKYSPEDLRIVLVDPKVVEFSKFRNMPNLMFNEVFTDNARVCSMLEWAVREMEKRYQILNESGQKNINDYNEYVAGKHGKKLFKILIIIDEFADLMNSSSERKLMENKISRLAAKSRAAGIHLIMATQRPSADIMEGSIKTNFISRIAFKAASGTDAQVIMGEIGAEKLLGRGDMLFRTSSMPTCERAQGCFVDSPEIDAVCDFVKQNNKCYYDEFALESILKGASAEESSGDSVGASGGGDFVPTKSDDGLIKEAMRFAITINNVSISGLQRKLGLGFPKAGKLMDTLIEKGYVSPVAEGKQRKIFMTREQFAEIFGEPV